MSTNTVRLYVPLLGEGTDVLRPATGVFVAPDVVRLEAPADYDPASEEWEFPPGTEVRCVAELRGGGQVLVARHRVIDVSTAANPALQPAGGGG